MYSMNSFRVVTNPKV